MINLSKEKIYYVYAYCDPRKQINRDYLGLFFKYEPFYIGKGYGRRKFSHLKEYNKEIKLVENGEKTLFDVHRKVNKIKNIRRAGLEPVIIELENELCEKDAFDIEEIFIEEIDRIEDGGCLFNYRSGGEYGGRLSESSKKKISKSLEEYYKSINKWDYERGSRIAWNKGVPMKEDAKDHLSKINSGKKQNPESVKKRARANKKNWENNKESRWEKMKKTMKDNGYVRDNDSIGDKISAAKKGNVIITENQRKKISNTLKEKHKRGEIGVWDKGISSKSLRVCRIDLNGELLEVIDSIGRAGDLYGDRGSIRKHIKNNTVYKGCKWMRYDDWIKENKEMEAVSG